MMRVEKKEWGFDRGYKVWLFKLTNKNGVSASLTNYGAAVVSLLVPDRDGKLADVVLGYDNLDGYINGGSSQGATIGRFANRIGGGVFSLNGNEYRLEKNNGDNCLHGGSYGFSRRVFTVKSFDDNGVVFAYTSPDGEGNFPAEVQVQVKYALTEDNSLKIDYYAVSDGDTVLNLTNHAYFNLGGHDSGDVLDTELQLFSCEYTPFDNFSIPTGTISGVHKTVFDFTEPKRIGAEIEPGNIDGYDHNFILGEVGIMRKAASAYHKASGREMTVFSDMPAMQFYTANGLDETGKGGKHYGKYHAFCLETQFSPDSPNLPEFPNCVLKNGVVFKSETIYKFDVR